MAKKLHGDGIARRCLIVPTELWAAISRAARNDQRSVSAWARRVFERALWERW